MYTRIQNFRLIIMQFQSHLYLIITIHTIRKYRIKLHSWFHYNPIKIKSSDVLHTIRFAILYIIWIVDHKIVHFHITYLTNYVWPECTIPYVCKKKTHFIEK